MRLARWVVRSLSLSFVALAVLLAASASAEEADSAEREARFPWLDNEIYKIHLDINARIELAGIDGFSASQAYTIRTRAGLEAKPYYGFSALAELENTWSLADSQYWDGIAPNARNQSIIADPENTELNRAWLQYERHQLLDTKIRTKAKGGIQRIVLDDSRWIGNIVWRQNEQTFRAALGETDFSIEGLTAQYAYLWHIQRIYGNQGNASTQDWESDSHLGRVNYTGFEGHDLTAFLYHLDFESDSPGNSATTYGVRAAGSFELDDDLTLGYSTSYAFQTDSGSNPVNYDAHYFWGSLDLTTAGLGKIGATYELLGSDDGKARIVTPLATAHKFNGWADAFLDNGGVRGLHDLIFTVSPDLPWKLAGVLAYHEFWRSDGGSHLGREFDASLSRAFNDYFTGLVKGAVFDGSSRGPADRWRVWFQMNFHY